MDYIFGILIIIIIDHGSPCDICNSHPSPGNILYGAVIIKFQIQQIGFWGLNNRYFRFGRNGWYFFLGRGRCRLDRWFHLLTRSFAGNED
jgi:hypothetical protein